MFHYEELFPLNCFELVFKWEVGVSVFLDVIS